MVSPESSAGYASRYLGPDGDPKAPLASPLYADLAGLPPRLILVGTAEVLLDDSTRLAEKARAASVEVELQIWDDMIHIWPYFANMIPEGREAIARMGAYIRRRIGKMGYAARVRIADEDVEVHGSADCLRSAAGRISVKEVCRKMGIGQATFF